MTLANAAYLGIERYANASSKENWINGSEADKAALIRAVYQQVLGNQYVMASERLEGPESLFKRGYLSVREFVRQVAKSGLYRAKFFENCNAYRFIELNFKHLLGRAPQNKAEMLHHFTILQEQGVDAEIDSYLDSAEYQERFGEEVVPFLHGWNYSAGQQGLQFSYMLQLSRGGAGASVRGSVTKNQSTLNPSVHSESPVPVVSPSTKAAAFRKVSSDGVTRQGVGSGEEGRTFRVNSDAIAVEVAEAMQAMKILFLSASDGLYVGGELVRQPPPSMPSSTSAFSTAGTAGTGWCGAIRPR
jgi:phycoerythrin-associated linker protein